MRSPFDDGGTGRVIARSVHFPLRFYSRMIFSENRCTLFRIMR
jgi:hypothetical protein